MKPWASRLARKVRRARYGLGFFYRVSASIDGFAEALIPRDIEREYSEIVDFAGRSESPWDILAVTPGPFHAALVERALILDKPARDELFGKMELPLGAPTRARPIRAIKRISRLMLIRLVRRVAPNGEAERRAYFAAWYFAFWAESCMVIPARRLARRLAATASDQLILVPLPSDRPSCLSYWEEADLEPFVLAAELRRRGARVLLFTDDSLTVQRLTRSRRRRLRFAPVRQWRAERRAGIPPGEGSAILVAEGVRHPTLVKSRLGAIAFATVSGRENLWVRTENAEPIEVALAPVEGDRRVALLSPAGEVPSLIDGFVALLGPLTQAAWSRAREIVRVKKLRHAHVCDHLFFGNALISHAVAEAGGSVTLWPHSTNPCDTEVQFSEVVSRIYAITRSGARRWAEVVPADRIRVDSSLMLDPPALPRSVDPSAPVHIIIFAGSHSWRGLPVVVLARHQQAWRAFFPDLAELTRQFRVLVKPKPPWEAEDWLRALMPSQRSFEFVSTPTKALDYPNMLFVSVSLGSSALLEGLGLGIPSMILREFYVDDYTPFRGENFVFPCAAALVSEIRRCRAPEHYTDLARSQIEWLETETAFPAT